MEFLFTGNAVGEVERHLVNPTAHTIFERGFRGLWRKKTVKITPSDKPQRISTIEMQTSMRENSWMVDLDSEKYS